MCRSRVIGQITTCRSVLVYSRVLAEETGFVVPCVQSARSPGQARVCPCIDLAVPIFGSDWTHTSPRQNSWLHVNLEPQPVVSSVPVASGYPQAVFLGNRGDATSLICRDRVCRDVFAKPNGVFTMTTPTTGGTDDPCVWHVLRSVVAVGGGRRRGPGWGEKAV